MATNFWKQPIGINSSVLASRFITVMKTLRAAKSAPSLRRAIQHSAPSPNPTSLLSTPSHYNALSLKALKSECKKKGIKVSGRKADLIDRLWSFDASKSSNAAHSAGFSTSKTSSVQATKSTNIAVNKPENMTSTLPRTLRGTKSVHFNVSLPKLAKGDESSIDYYRFPVGGFDPPQEPKKMTIPLLPNLAGSAINIKAPEYSRHIPDGGAAESNGTDGMERVHALGETPVHTLMDDSTIQPGDESGSYEGSKASEKDNRFFALFTAGVAAWWLSGSLGKKSKRNH